MRWDRDVVEVPVLKAAICEINPCNVVDTALKELPNLLGYMYARLNRD